MTETTDTATPEPVRLPTTASRPAAVDSVRPGTVIEPTTGPSPLVLDEKRETVDGWELYGRPLARPTSGRRYRVTADAGSSISVRANDDELDKIRATLAEELRHRTVGGGTTSVEVLNLTPEALTLEVAGWRLVI